MERLSPGPLAEALRANRKRLNARCALARRRGRRLDPDAVAALLAGPVQGAVGAVAERDAAAAPRAALELSELAIDLAAKGYLGAGSRHPAVDRAWERLLPALAVPLAAGPGRLAASLTNALCALSAESDAMAGRWIDEMDRVAPHFDGIDGILDAGAVLAWRCGMAHYRESALRRWRGLPLPARRLLLGLEAEGAGTPAEEELEERIRHRWHDPSLSLPAQEPPPSIVARAGGFRGFGGPFVEPPVVESVGGRIVAFDREGSWLLCADFHGALFRRLRAGEDRGAAPRRKGPFAIDPRGWVTAPGGGVEIAAFEHSSSHASTETELAVTVPRSHFVTVVAPGWGPAS